MLVFSSSYKLYIKCLCFFRDCVSLWYEIVSVALRDSCGVWIFLQLFTFLRFCLDCYGDCE